MYRVVFRVRLWGPSRVTPMEERQLQVGVLDSSSSAPEALQMATEWVHGRYHPVIYDVRLMSMEWQDLDVVLSVDQGPVKKEAE